jgi:hypothetical protein
VRLGVTELDFLILNQTEFKGEGMPGGNAASSNQGAESELKICQRRSVVGRLPPRRTGKLTSKSGHSVHNFGIQHLAFRLNP